MYRVCARSHARSQQEQGLTSIRHPPVSTTKRLHPLLLTHCTERKQKKCTEFKNRNLMFSACLIFLFTSVSPGRCSPCSVDLRFIQTTVRQREAFFFFFKQSLTYTQHSHLHHSLCCFLIFSISVTAAHQDIHIEICPSLLIHSEMSSCTATDVSAVSLTLPRDTAS